MHAELPTAVRERRSRAEAYRRLASGQPTPVAVAARRRASELELVAQVLEQVWQPDAAYERLAA